MVKNAKGQTKKKKSLLIGEENKALHLKQLLTKLSNRRVTKNSVAAVNFNPLNKKTKTKINRGIRGGERGRAKNPWKPRSVVHVGLQGDPAGN